MCLNNLSSYLTKLGSIITALADLINTFTLASYATVSIYGSRAFRPCAVRVGQVLDFNFVFGYN